MNSVLMLGIILFSVAFLTINTGQAQVQYEVTRLDTISVGQFHLGGLSANSVNNSRQVVGTHDATFLSRQALLWQNGNLTNIATLGGTSSTAFGINDAGKIVGWSENGDGDYRAFLWHNDSIVDLDTRGKNYESAAYAINNQDLVVGWDYSHAILWQNGIMIDLHPDTAYYASAAFDINNRGQAVGFATVNNIDDAKAILWFNGSVTILNSLGGNYTVAYGINDSGSVVGASSNSNGQLRAFLWKDSLMTNLGTLDGDYIGASAHGINDVGHVVGSAVHSSGVRRAFLWRDGAIMDLNNLIDSSSGWTLREAASVNNHGEITGWGIHNGMSKTFLLTPKLNITRPTSNVKWIAGEQDTIRWTGGQAGRYINLGLSSDSGQTFDQSVAILYPSDSGWFAWDIPEDILSTKCRIRIVDVLNHVDADTSDAFRIKGYVLTRDSSGQYEPFRFNKDVWQFGNHDYNMWPPVWYQRFNYQNGTDPYTNQPYPSDPVYPFFNAQNQDFPDWPLFVKAFGTGQCYWGGPINGNYSLRATSRWDAIKYSWYGSCTGFAISSLLAFDDSAGFRGRYPEIPAFDELYSVNLDTTVRKVVNELWIYQWGVLQKHYEDVVARKMTPTQTVQLLKATLLPDSPEPRFLSLQNNTGSGAHDVAPYKVSRNPNNPDEYWIHVYDSKHPAAPNRIIEVDTTDHGGRGSWFYSELPSWSGSADSGLFVMDQVSNYLTTPLLSLPGSPTRALQATNNSAIEVFPTLGVEVRIEDAAGDSTGYQDSLAYNTIPDGWAFTAATGANTPPYSYVLPQGAYTITTSRFAGLSSKLFVFSDSTVMRYERSDADNSQTDRFGYDGALSLRNPDPQTKQIHISALLIEDTTAEKSYTLTGLATAQGDSMHFSRANHDDLKITNVGTQKAYDLHLDYASATSSQRFRAFGITLESNSSHLVVPDWSGFQQPVPIYIDIGNNGTIDDTLHINNTVSVDDQGSPLLPEDYNLAQNYPNPFNPTTVIQYSIPVQSHVTLKVYDVLGREVATIVNEKASPGEYTRRWDAAGVPSGVYFYRMSAGSFNATKKLLLIR